MLNSSTFYQYIRSFELPHQNSLSSLLSLSFPYQYLNSQITDIIHIAPHHHYHFPYLNSSSSLSIPQLIVNEELPKELEPLVEDTEQEEADHGAKKAAQGGDSPEVEQDDFFVTAMEVHHHHHV